MLYKQTFLEYKHLIWSFVGAFIGIGLIAFWQSHLVSKSENIFLIGSFGASSVLIYAAIDSPLSQPRNLIGGHLVSAFIGVSVYKIFPDIVWLSAPLVVALSIVMMQITKTLHPPGGATALIAIIGSEKIKALGYLYVLSPVLTGSLILFLVAVLFNNLIPGRSYPKVKTITLFRKKKK